MWQIETQLHDTFGGFLAKMIGINLMNGSSETSPCDKKFVDDPNENAKN